MRWIGSAEGRLHDEQHEPGYGKQHANAVRDGISDLFAERVERLPGRGVVLVVLRILGA